MLVSENYILLTRYKRTENKKREQNMTSAVIYTRTSTNDQELGHLAQGAECRAHAEAQGLEVIAVYTDTCSGTLPILHFCKGNYNSKQFHLKNAFFLMDSLK